MEDPKYQLVLQLPGATQVDFEHLASLEELLADAFDETPHQVDGHDFGSGTMNIFIDTNDPGAAFEIAKQIVTPTKHPALKVAFRSFEEDDYQLIWPENSNDQFELF